MRSGLRGPRPSDSRKTRFDLRPTQPVGRRGPAEAHGDGSLSRARPRHAPTGVPIPEPAAQARSPTETPRRTEVLHTAGWLAVARLGTRGLRWRGGRIGTGSGSTRAGSEPMPEAVMPPPQVDAQRPGVISGKKPTRLSPLASDGRAHNDSALADHVARKRAPRALDSR
jgi:hypothetical protein